MASQCGEEDDRTTILVVDDEEAIRELIRTVLAPIGARVLLTGSAEEARAVAADTQIDLLLTDVVLPGANGAELATTLRAAQPALQVIYMTGWREHVELADVPDAMVLGKPFQMKELARVVASALGHDA
jgi:DNA-binding NtrC family response regulator